MAHRTVCVGAVQMQSANSDTLANLKRASGLVEQAATLGAELVLLPELFSTGFEFTEAAWKNAEPQGGPTERWLCELSRHFGIYLGGSYMEVAGDDFLNTFALAQPDGTIAGRVHKHNPCAMEAYLFKAMPGSHVIDTALGRIGIAICYDGSLRCVYDNLFANNMDLMLFPVSAPSPVKTWFYPQSKVDGFHAVFRDAATLIAAGLGVPVVMANKCGPWESAFPSFWPRQKSQFPGFSHIADRDGSEMARLDAQEGVIVATVTLDPTQKTLKLGPDSDRWRPWIMKVPSEYRLFPLIEALGRGWYGRNKCRKALARMRSDAETSGPTSQMGPPSLNEQADAQ